MGLVLIEAALQLMSLAVHRRAVSAQTPTSDDEYRILCIGESMTFGTYWHEPDQSWPRQLETRLRQERLGRNIRVINAGVVGINSDGILEHLDEWLETYRPHVVISMIGINDIGNPLVYEYPGAPEVPPVIGRLRTYKFVRLLWRSMRSPKATTVFDQPAVDADSKRLGLAVLGAEAAFDYTKSIEVRREMARLLGQEYHYTAVSRAILNYARPDFQKRFFKTIFGADIASLPDLQQEQMLTSFRQAHPDNFAAPFYLTTFYRRTRRFAEEEATLREALKRPRIAGYAALRLADFYFQAKDTEAANHWFDQATRLIPQDRVMYVVLGNYALQAGWYRKAAAMYERALALRTDRPIDLRDTEYRRLGLVYRLLGEEEKARRYAERDAELSLADFRPQTRRNYERLVDKVRARGSLMIAMQYPMLSVAPLRKMLEDRGDRIIFVDNEAIFKDALRDHPYAELFVDQFGGAFGHPTAKGDALIAENVLHAILRIL